MTLRLRAAFSAIVLAIMIPAAGCDRGGQPTESVSPPAGDRPAVDQTSADQEAGETAAAHRNMPLEPGVIATIDGEAVTENEYADYLAEASFLAKQASFEGRMEVAWVLLDQKLVIQDAKARGIDERPMVRRMVERYRRRLVQGEVLKKIMESVPPVEDEEIEARLGTPGDRLNLTVILAGELETAESAIARIGRGEEMKEVAAELSISPGVMSRNFRRLGFERGEGMYPPEAEEAIFALEEGELSAPLLTPVGYLVARLDRRIVTTPEEIEELRSSIEMNLRRKKIEKAVREEAARRRESTPVTVLVERVADMDLPSPDGDSAAVWRALEEISAAEVGGVTLTFGDIVRDVSDYRQYLGSNAANQEKVYRREIEENADQVLFARYARELGYDTMDPVADAVEAYTGRLLLAQNVADVYLAVGLEDLDDGECRAYFEENIGRYPVPPLFTLSVILTRKKEQLDEVLARYRTGASFEDLAREYSADPSAREGGDLGTLLSDDLVQRLSEEGVKELVAAARAGQRGPITLRTTAGYSTFLIRDFKDEGEGGFEAVRERVLPDFLRVCRKEGMEEKIAALRGAAEIVIDEEKVATIEPDFSDTPTGSTPHGGVRSRGRGSSPHGGGSPHGGSLPAAPAPPGGSE